MNELDFMSDTMRQLLGGLPITLQLAVISISCGIVLAVLLAALRRSCRLGEWFVRGYVFVLRGSPLLLQIFFVYYGLGQFAAVRDSVLWPFLRQPWWCAILALTLNTGAYGSEIVRGGLHAVPPSILLAMAGPAAIRFGPDGDSSGGAVRVAGTARALLVQVDWITGRVAIADAH